MKKKYSKFEFNKYLSIVELTKEDYGHGSNVSEGTNATYNVQDCADAKANEDDPFAAGMCLYDVLGP